MTKNRNLIVTLALIACFSSILLYGIFNNKQLKRFDTYSAPISSFPGEFDKQQAIWLMWPSDVYETGDRKVSPVTINLIKALVPYIRVNLMVQSQNQIAQIENLLKAQGYTGNNLKYYIIDHYSIWARDVGPIFVKGNNSKLQVVNFGFNNYSRDGSPQYVNTESQVDKLTAQALNLPVIDTNLISEGGAIESNGRGTLMLTEAVAFKRNPNLTRQQIENEYKGVLGIKKVIWLKKGLAEDDNVTSGHINEIARFANPNTILLAQILQGDRYANADSAESYLRLEENFKILQNSTDQDGKPFNIIRIPMPPTLYAESNATGELPVRSYINYAVTNGAVLLQVYWKPGRSDTLKTTENQVKATFQKVFPGRKIIDIDAENVNKWGGGIHCITQHMPAQ